MFIIINFARTIRAWRSLPKDVVESNILDIFKSTLPHIEDITWPHGDMKFLFVLKNIFNTRREISYLQAVM